MQYRELKAGDRVYFYFNSVGGTYRKEPEVIERVTATQAVAKGGTRFKLEMRPGYGGRGWQAMEVGNQYSRGSYWLESAEILQEIQAQTDRVLVKTMRWNEADDELISKVAAVIRAHQVQSETLTAKTSNDE